MGKYEDISKELNEWKFDVVGITETHLRDDLRVDGSEYGMIGKGRKKQEKRGGGIALLYRKERGMKVEEMDVGTSADSEDILAVKVECRNEKGKPESMIVVVAYMTVEGERAIRENRGKYDILRKVVREHARERVVVMGDMKAHTGIR